MRHSSNQCVWCVFHLIVSFYSEYRHAAQMLNIGEEICSYSYTKLSELHVDVCMRTCYIARQQQHWKMVFIRYFLIYCFFGAFISFFMWTSFLRTRFLPLYNSEEDDYQRYPPNRLLKWKGAKVPRTKWLIFEWVAVIETAIVNSEKTNCILMKTIIIAKSTK